MSSLSRLRKNILKNDIERRTKLKPKQKCPKCNQYTVYKVTKDGCMCIMCEEEFIFKEKKL